MRNTSAVVFAPIPSRLLLAALVAGMALSSAGCFRSRLLKSKPCAPGDLACQAGGDETDAAVASGGAAGDARRDGSGGVVADGPADGKRDGSGAGGGGAGGGAGGTGGKRDGASDPRPDSDGSRDLPADAKRDRDACGAVEICDNGGDDDCNGYTDCYDKACQALPSCITKKTEDCTDGIDNDGNGKVDCQDEWCFADKACVVPGKEVCTNGLDDDEDGLTDCKDPDCAQHPGCLVTSGDEICDNGKDDNRDGLTDCTDPKCKTFPACLTSACTPDAEFGAIASSGAAVTRTMTTTGSPSTFTTCAPPGGVARVGSFSLAAAADLKLDISQDKNAAHVVALFRAGVGQACDQNPVDYDCLDAGTKATASKTYNALAPGSYWVIVQSYPGTAGGTTITLSTGASGTVEVCGNGIDDDKDGAIDCADLDCATSSTCNLCIPEIDLGTIVVDDTAKTAELDTRKGSNRYHPIAAGLSTGNDIVVQFSVKETVGMILRVWQYSGNHSYGLFNMPPAGGRCDVDEASDQGVDLGTDYYSAMNWHFFTPGHWLLIFKANAPGQEGTLDIELSAYANRGVESCENGIDDDGDLLIDCADPDCYNLPMCQAPMCVPDGDLGDIGIDDEVSVKVDTTTATKVYRAECGRGDGRSRAYRVNLLEPMDLYVDCTQASGDQVLQLAPQLSPLAACDADIHGCFDPGVMNGRCGFGWPALQPGVYYVLVNAFASGDEGKMSLTLTGAEAAVKEICDNGIDDDQDGATDCSDRKCAGDPTCTSQRCRPSKDLGLVPLDGSRLSTAVQTSDEVDEQTKTTCVSGPGGEDAVVRFDLPGDTDLTLEWAQVGNHALALYKADTVPLPCEANQLVDCHATAGALTGSYALGKLGAGKYYLVVDADKAGSEGGVILQISGKPAAP